VVPHDPGEWLIRICDAAGDSCDISDSTFTIRGNRTWHVPADAPTVRAGIDSAIAGDTVVVASGYYNEWGLSMKSGVILRSETGDPEWTTIDANYAGTVMYCDDLDSTTTIEGITFLDGYDDGEGGLTSAWAGGMMCRNSSHTIINCSFVNNESEGKGFMHACHGGGMCLLDSSSVTLINCTFSGNRVDGDEGARGGGLYCHNSSPSLTNCIFTDNSAYDAMMVGVGAGMYCTYSSSPTLTGCLFVRNESGAASALASYSSPSSPTIVQNTIFAYNTGGDAVLCHDDSSAIFSCTDIYGNPGGDWTDRIAWQEGIDGNISLPPGFCDIESDSFHLCPESPCYDASGCGQIGPYGLGCGGMQISSIEDIGNDQGRWVRVRWDPSAFDTPGAYHTIMNYALWRRIDLYAKPESSKTSKLASTSRAHVGASLDHPGALRDYPGALRDYPPGDWECVITVPASGEDYYTAVSPTVCDSTATGGICWSVFFVRAYTDDPFSYFDCKVDSGYSIDNLEPNAPSKLKGIYTGSGIALDWAPNTEEDLRYYKIYRVEDSLDPPLSGDLLHTTIDTSYTDYSGNPHTYYRYWVAAVDFSDNESDPTPWPPSSTSVDEPAEKVPTQVALRGVVPNPFNPRTVVYYDLPEPGRALLRVFNANGQLVRTLVDEEMPAGHHHVEWNGLDSGGDPVSAGVYFCKLVACGEVISGKMVLLE
jgi:hypothetical protein